MYIFIRDLSDSMYRNSPHPGAFILQSKGLYQYVILHHPLLGALAEFQKATIGFVKPVGPHGTTRLILDG